MILWESRRYLSRTLLEGIWATSVTNKAGDLRTLIASPRTTQWVLHLSPIYREHGRASTFRIPEAWGRHCSSFKPLCILSFLQLIKESASTQADKKLLAFEADFDRVARSQRHHRTWGDLLVVILPVFSYTRLSVPIQTPNKSHTHTHIQPFELPIPTESGSLEITLTLFCEWTALIKETDNMRQSQSQQTLSLHSWHTGRQINLLVLVQVSAKFRWFAHLY